MTAVPNLYLKWRAFRVMFPDDRADADFANLILIDDEIDTRASKFSKLLKGDVGLKPRVAERLAKTVNDQVAAFRSNHKLSPLPALALSIEDLHRPLYDFIRGLLAATGKVDADKLERIQAALLDLISPWRSKANRAPRLLVERGGERFGWEQSDDEPIEFEVGELGRFTVQGLAEAPVAAYVYATRDPSPIGQHLWDLKWRETVMWLPSPFVPGRRGADIALTEPKEIQPMLGRFLVTAVLVSDEAVQAKLDPRGKNPAHGGLNEEQTSRFLTNLHRLEERNPHAVAIATNEYFVKG